MQGFDYWKYFKEYVKIKMQAVNCGEKNPQ